MGQADHGRRGRKPGTLSVVYQWCRGQVSLASRVLAWRLHLQAEQVLSGVRTCRRPAAGIPSRLVRVAAGQAAQVFRRSLSIDSGTGSRSSAALDSPVTPRPSRLPRAASQVERRLVNSVVTSRLSDNAPQKHEAHAVD